MALPSTVSRSNWNLEMLVFVEGGKPEYPEKNPRSRDENQQQTQPTYDAETGNRTRATLVGGNCSHHCAIPAPTYTLYLLLPYCRTNLRKFSIRFQGPTLFNSLSREIQNSESISLAKDLENSFFLS